MGGSSRRDPVAQYDDAFDLHLDSVASRDLLGFAGRAGEDYVARQERHVLAAVAQDLVGREHELAGARGLPDLAVDARLGLQAVVVGPGHDRRTDRSETVRALVPAPL